MSVTQQAAIRFAHVLIVEEDPEIAACVRILLDQERYRVSVAGDEREALERIAVDRPDAVLLGPCLAASTGRRLQERLRARKLDVPVVFANATGIGDVCRRSGDPASSLDLALLVRAVARLALARSGA